MKIIIDVGPMGEEQFIETDQTKHSSLVEHPNGNGEKITKLKLLEYLNTHPEARVSGKWDEVNLLAGETVALSRWDRLVKAANHPTADSEVKALNLK